MAHSKSKEIWVLYRISDPYEPPMSEFYFENRESVEVWLKEQEITEIPVVCNTYKEIRYEDFFTKEKCKSDWSGPEVRVRYEDSYGEIQDGTGIFLKRENLLCIND